LQQDGLGGALSSLGDVLGQQAKAATPQQGHDQGVCCLVVSKGFLYSGSFDSFILKWGLHDKKQKAVFRGHQEAVYRISMQDVWLLSVSRDATVRVWNETSTECIAILKWQSWTSSCTPVRTTAASDSGSGILARRHASTTDTPME
jgi:WD40 repeat protein